MVHKVKYRIEVYFFSALQHSDTSSTAITFQHSLFLSHIGLFMFPEILKTGSDYFPNSINGLAFVWETECFLRSRKWIFITIAPEVHDFRRDLKILGTSMTTDQQILRRHLTKLFRHCDLASRICASLNRPTWDLIGLQKFPSFQ